MTASSEAEVQLPTGDVATTARRPAAVRVLIEWGVPVVLGAALGALILWGAAFLKSDAQRIVDRWQYDDVGLEADLEDELMALGESARKDLREVFLAFDDPSVPELLMWLAGVIGREPFYDTRFLEEQARAGKTWQRRTAAVALVKLLDRKVDPDVVLDGIFDWLEDDQAVTHEFVISALRAMLQNNLVPADRRERSKLALMHLADRIARGDVGAAGRVEPGDDPASPGADVHSYDRSAAIEALSSFLPDDRAVWDLIERVARDEEEFEEVRIMTVRVLTENKALDHEAFWRELAKSPVVSVRQCVAENLFRTKSAGLNDVLLALQSDAGPLVRSGAINTQRQRRMATPIKEFHELAEDSDPYVRFEAIRAAGTFKDHEGGGGRAGHILEILRTSDEVIDVEACVLTLFEITKQHYGFKEVEIMVPTDRVDEAPLEAFMKDAKLRADAAESWAGHFGGAAVFTVAERRAVLEKLLQHADPLNRERAKAELARLK
jgi:hypothetical protein